MSRQIKFRGKRVYSDKWVYGYYAELVENGEYFYWINEPNGDSTDVIPETVGQYVGLKDRHGVKIYEGDILEGLGCVVWGDRECRFLIDIIGERYEIFFDELSQNELEVIGNIHERSE